MCSSASWVVGPAVIRMLQGKPTKLNCKPTKKKNTKQPKKKFKVSESPTILIDEETDGRLARVLSRELPAECYLSFLRVVIKLKKQATRIKQASATRLLKRQGSTESVSGSIPILDRACTISDIRFREVQSIKELHPEDERVQKIMEGKRLLGQRLENFKLKMQTVGDDGNCQFRSFSHQLYGTEDYHGLVRATAMDQISKQNRDYYQMFFDTCVDLDRYIEGMSKSRKWGDELTVKAVSDAYGVDIHVVQSTPDNWYLHYDPEIRKVQKSLFVTYISPIHYNSIIVPNKQLLPRLSYTHTNGG